MGGGGRMVYEMRPFVFELALVEARLFPFYKDWGGQRCDKFYLP